jgi:formylglycine-generating enzyme required for sulfatase activity
MKAAALFLMLLTAMMCLAQNIPQVTNVVAQQRQDGSKLVDVWYDLTDYDGNPCEITLEVSSSNSDYYDIIPSPVHLSGNVGTGVTPGTSKHIVWNAGAESLQLVGSQFRFRVTADDHTSDGTQSNFIFVQGGTFFNGTSNVTLDSFYLDKFELTQDFYMEVMKVNPSGEIGIGPDYPVNQVSWFDAIEFCNRWSIQSQLIPCYSYGAYGTNPDYWPTGWNQDWGNQYNISCNWSASGYRLPSEMEWMFAAKGGIYSQNYIYSGNNNVDMVAWYMANAGGSAHKVGQKLPNELGFYDMSGNLWEWVWDYYADYATGNQTNPHGAYTGTAKVNRGGYYQGQGAWCAVSFRNWGGYATDVYHGVGFRVCHNAPPPPPGSVLY